MSSCATAARAIMTAVGFLICISRRRTLPSLVSLMPGRWTEREGKVERARTGHARRKRRAARCRLQRLSTLADHPSRWARSLAFAMVQAGAAGRTAQPGVGFVRPSRSPPASRSALLAPRSSRAPRSPSPSPSLPQPPGSGRRRVRVRAAYVCSLSRTSRPVDQHLDRPCRAQVCCHHVAQALGRVDRHEQGRHAAHDLRLGVERLDGGHGCVCVCVCVCVRAGGWSTPAGAKGEV